MPSLSGLDAGAVGDVPMCLDPSTPERGEYSRGNGGSFFCRGLQMAGGGGDKSSV